MSDPDLVARLDTGDLRQPDRLSCGAASALAAELLVTPDPADPRWGADAFGAAVLARHRALTSTRSRGGLQVPWPPALGTPPWALANDLTVTTGRRYEVRWRRGGTAAERSDLPIGLYVGSRLLPRHVVLVIGRSDAGPRIYEPSSGRVVSRSPSDFTGRRLRLGGWDYGWFSVEPTSVA